MELMSRASCVALIAILGFRLPTNAQSSDPNKLLFIDTIHVSGTRNLGTGQLNEIIGPLNLLKVESSGEIEDRLRIQFQEYGYFDADVKSVTIKPPDPLANPIPVDVTAEVLEGPRFVFGDIQFTGIHSLSADELRTKFPVHAGRLVFTRSHRRRIASTNGGLWGKRVHRLLCRTRCAEARRSEGSYSYQSARGDQYRMGTLQIAGDTEDSEQLRVRWQLEPGRPLDATYLPRFLEDNTSLLPAQFEMSRSTKIARDCQNHTVIVYIELSPNHPNVTPPNDVGCDEKSKSPAQ